MEEATRQVVYGVVARLSKELVKRGLSKNGLTYAQAKLIAEQLGFTIELLEKGARLDGRQLAVMLTGKVLSIAQVGLDERGRCAVAVAVLGISAGQILLAGPAGPAVALYRAAALLQDAYEMDEVCGVSEATQRYLEETSWATYRWLEDGVRAIYVPR